MIITFHQSLSFDFIAKPHRDIHDARDYMQRVLIQEGWPSVEAAQAAAKGSPVLVRDSGDDETIEIRELKP